MRSAEELRSPLVVAVAVTRAVVAQVESLVVRKMKVDLKSQLWLHQCRCACACAFVCAAHLHTCVHMCMHCAYVCVHVCTCTSVSMHACLCMYSMYCIMWC